MTSIEINNLIKLAKEASNVALESLHSNKNTYLKSNFQKKLDRELKSEIDFINNKLIIDILKKSNIPYISEESPSNLEHNNLNWIIDPLDGTINYVRDIGSCGISIALFNGKNPIFGVFAEYPSGKLYWGGKKIGAFCDDIELNVSYVSNKKNAVLATGFPSRYDFNQSINNQMFSEYAKIRMLGSAAFSLVNVAKGSIDCYNENNIMIWDVAAGIAIVEGAGGSYHFDSQNILSPLNVYADNGKLNK